MVDIQKAALSFVLENRLKAHPYLYLIGLDFAQDAIDTGVSPV